MKNIVYSTIISLYLQFSIFLGMLFSLLIGIFYLLIADTRLPQENIFPILVGTILSLLIGLIGRYLHHHTHLKINVDYKVAVLIVVETWIIASLISAVVYILAGFPNSIDGHTFSALRVFTDSFFESMSGLTTTGSSILMDIESLPRSVLIWRAFTHWLGGMGIVYMTITIIKNFVHSRFNLINAEVESPEATEFKDEHEARNSGFDFIKIYSFLTILMITMLIISGFIFRETPYDTWYDNVFDAISHGFSTLGTGGFSNYSASAGIYTISDTGQIIIGGLQNKVSEWIITIFMFISGTNFGIWYLFIYKRDWRSFYKNIEMRVYFMISVGISLSIAFILLYSKFHSYTLEESLRYSFFSVASIISTTGLANVDFTVWPSSALALLFITYFIGGTVGSTSGGLKVKRFIAFFINLKNEIVNFIYRKDEFKPVKVDDSEFNRRDISLISINIAIYFIIFLLAAVILMYTEPFGIDFITAMNSSIAHLGNIGPADFIGSVNDGPTGSYASFGIFSKWILIFLMLFGRIGVLNIFIFISNFVKIKN